MTPERPLHFAVLIAVLIAAPFSGPATAAPPAVCGDVFRTEAELAEIEALRTELAKTSELRVSHQTASKAATDALIETFSEVKLGTDEKRVLQDVKVLIENPLFDEALARSFSVGGMKKGESILDFQTKLKLASEARQIEFSEFVLKQYGELLEKAFVWADEDQFEMIGKRWKMSTEQTYDILTRWAASEITDRASIRIAVLAWTKAIDPASVVRDIRALKRIPRKMHLDDAEEVLLTRIRKPHYDLDLAKNVGPISDTQFAWRLRLWNFLGSAQYALHAIRYPKESAFIIALSIAPVTLVHAIGKDWNFTNTVATIIGGVATCPPLIMQLTKRAAIANHEPIFLEVLTLRQLSELGRWIESHPKRAHEVGFANLEKPIEARIAVLRSLRYSPSKASP